MAWINDRFMGDNRIQLGYEEIIRPMSISTDWQSLRIGLRFAINDNAKSTFNQWALLIGVCQGNNGLFATSTTDWIGGGIIGSSTPTGATGGVSPVFTADTPNYFTIGNAANALSRIGGTSLYSTATVAAAFWCGTGTGGYVGSQNMSHWYVDITKTSSASYAITNYYPASAANVKATCTDAIFKANMGTTAAATNVSSSAYNLAYFGSGLFDTLSIAHYKGWPNIEIDAIWVTRLL